MKRIEFRGRVLRRREIGARCVRKLRQLRQGQSICRKHYRRVQRDVRRWQYTRRLRRNHRLTAIVMLVGWLARHRPTALHALRVQGHGRHTVRELQEQYRRYGQHHKCRFPSHCRTLEPLDASVKELDTAFLCGRTEPPWKGLRESQGETG